MLFPGNTVYKHASWHYLIVLICLSSIGFVFGMTALLRFDMLLILRFIPQYNSGKSRLGLPDRF
ncbi:hypothetical protein OK016_23290 [Vibrio chagasii]|nr:hypothetical protein [Vibrio chagasii]